MRTRHCLSPLATVLLLSTPPVAAGALNLKVSGNLIPGSCLVALSGDGALHFGLIEASTLNRDYSTPLPARQLDLSIDCVQPAKVALKIIDDRADSMIAGLAGPGTSDQEAFGLGRAGQARIGNYYVRMPRTGLYADDRRAELLYSVDGNKSWRRTGPAGELRRDRSFSWTWPDTRLPSQFKTLRSTLSVTPYIVQAAMLPAGHAIDLDGQASIELQYF